MGRQLQVTVLSTMMALVVLWNPQSSSAGNTKPIKRPEVKSSAKLERHSWILLSGSELIRATDRIVLRFSNVGNKEAYLAGECGQANMNYSDRGNGELEFGVASSATSNPRPCTDHGMKVSNAVLKAISRKVQWRLSSGPPERLILTGSNGAVLIFGPE